jgi:hypothetical protein
MSKQLKVIIVIICIGLGLFWHRIPDVLDKVVNRSASVEVAIAEPTPQLKETVKDISNLIAGPDAKIDKVQISDYFNQLANVVRDDPGLIDTTQKVRRFNSIAGQINFAGQSLKDKYNGLGEVIDNLIKQAIGDKNEELDQNKRDALVHMLKAIAWTLRN